MRFTKTFGHEGIKEKLKDIYETVFYNWSEFDPVVCNPNDEDKLKELGADLLTNLEELSDIIDKMGKINKDSFEC